MCVSAAIKRWQVVTDLQVDAATLESLAQYCTEFLVHAADVEGLCQGIDEVCERECVCVRESM